MTRRETAIVRAVQLILATVEPVRLDVAARRQQATRQRGEIVAYLRLQGGQLADDAGLVTRHLRLALGTDARLDRVLRAMETDGLLVRDVRGRRTYAVRLVGEHAATPEDTSEAVGCTADFEAFGAALLEMIEKRLAAVDPANRPRIEQLISYRAKLYADLDEYRTLVRDWGDAASGPARAFIERTRDLMTQRAVEFQARTGFPVDDALTAREHQTFHRLLQSDSTLSA